MGCNEEGGRDRQGASGARGRKPTPPLRGRAAASVGPVGESNRPTRLPGRTPPVPCRLTSGFPNPRIGEEEGQVNGLSPVPGMECVLPWAIRDDRTRGRRAGGVPVTTASPSGGGRSALVCGRDDPRDGGGGGSGGGGGPFPFRSPLADDGGR